MAAKIKVPKIEKEITNVGEEFFPKISRFITEEWKLILSSLVSGVFIFGIVLQSIELYHSLQAQSEIARARAGIEKELIYWKNQLGKYPEHRDIYFKIATLEYSLGNISEAKENLDKTLKIDPNFEKGREMESLF